MSTTPDELPDAIAVIGLAVRFPGANSPEHFWANLRSGSESLSQFSDEELQAAGVVPALINHPDYVRTNGVLADVDKFDADFFGMTPREAALTDPQHRVFLELAWEAMERAGYDSTRVPGPVGVFAGAGMSTYLLRNLVPNPDVVASAGELALLLGNNKDFVPTRTSYKLDLRGPSINVNTACSTSLVATHLACQSLLDMHCDMALAGGVSVQLPQSQGYLYTEGGIGSPDGHCRAFDAAAKGTVSGNGCGIVVLRRLTDALADGDHIHAIIRGSAVNNDGADKAGFTAPSVTGQSQVIAEAQAVADVDPADISYVEAHGTGTPLGDPIEVAALSEAFAGAPAGGCALGSVKSNFGHLDEAAGIAGLAKTILALEHAEIPPSLHFEHPNPQIDFENSAFRVNAQLSPWPRQQNRPLIAGVSSFGIGGTNAHVVVAEAPKHDRAPSNSEVQILILSARNESTLATARENLANWLDQNADADIADVAFTLAMGRREFVHRTHVIARSASEASRALRSSVHGSETPDTPPASVWVFSGQGSPYPGMLAGLYQRESVVRDTIDQCAEILREFIGSDLREILTPGAPNAAETLRDTAIAQPAVFVADYALAQLWRSQGLKPSAMIGHSLGEYVAACLAGVMSLEDALRLVATRGKLMAAQTSGAMLAIGANEDLASALAQTHALDVAAVNAPNATVLAGSIEAIAKLEEHCASNSIAATRLDTSHAFHSRMMEPMSEAFAQQVDRIKLSPPRLRIISALTGEDMTATQATSAEHWVRHVRETVRFSAAVSHAQSTLRSPIWLEIGPGRGLASMIKRSLSAAEADQVFTTTRHPAETTPDRDHLLECLGKLWRAGLVIDWAKWFAGSDRRRIVLPTYPFQRIRHWIDHKPIPGVEPAYFRLSDHIENLERAEHLWRSDELLVEHPRYAAFSRALNPWCARLLLNYFEAQGATGLTSHEAIAQTLRIQPAFKKFLSFMLHFLAQEGYLRKERDSVNWLRVEATDMTSATLREDFPEFSGIVRLVEHCTSQYAAALSGEIPAITVLYPEGKTSMLKSTASENKPHTDKRIYLSLLRQVIETKLNAINDRPLRIIEVGVGDGLLAGELAPALKDRRVEYVATDLSRSFTTRAKAKAEAAGLSFMKFAELDISRDPVDQGFQSGHFDFVIGLDVVHATASLAETLHHLGKLLIPGGCFGIVEKVRSEPWVDLVWGLAEGWWLFSDTELRPHTPLMAAAKWESLLNQIGFESVTVFPRTPTGRAETDYALLLAQTSSDPVVDVSEWFHGMTWNAVPHMRPDQDLVEFDASEGLPALMALAIKIGETNRKQTLLVRSDDSPRQLMLRGALRVIEQEYPQISCRHISQSGSELTPQALPLASLSQEKFLLRERGVYVITGGFGSMGRVFAREMARTHRARLVLLGRNTGGSDKTAFIHELESSGATVMARTVDVVDEAELKEIFKEAREKFGTIHGVIHTAGVYGQGLMRGRPQDEIGATLAPKIQGTENIVTACADQPLDWFILCSSLAGLQPEAGQIDYAVANSFLDAFAADYRERTGTVTTSVGWGVWQELGMMEHGALSPEQQQAVRNEIEREGWSNIGATLWEHLIRNGAGQAHLVVSPQPIANFRPPPSHPLLETRKYVGEGQFVYQVTLDPRSHWVVDEHRLDGLAILPGTGFLELARAAYVDATGATAVEMKEVYFLDPLTFPGDEVREVRVILNQNVFTIVSRVSNTSWLEHTRGEISPVEKIPAATDPATGFAWENPPPKAIAFGPHWQCLQELHFGENGGLAKFKLADDCSDDLDAYALHPALFDMAIGFVTLRHGLPDSLPFCYGELILHRPLPASFTSRVNVVSRSSDNLELDAELHDEAGNLLIEVRGYRLRRFVDPASTGEPDNARLLIRAGGADALPIVSEHRVAPGAHEVEIQVEAAGLNFIEVLYANGMLPASPDLENRFGLECAGRVVRVGAEVKEFSIDDEVIAYANGCFASYVNAPARAIMKQPASLSAEEAATLPGAYNTAHYALITRARLRPREKVLIHAAAGGVGMAAVNLAQQIGAEIYATAGSDSKRQYLRDLGVSHVLDSRSLEFADEVRRLTNGQGVDVVLNSLSGEFMKASLDLVAPRGRFIELGKRDLLAGNAIDLAPFARIISFIVIDVGPDLPEFDELWSEVSARIEDGRYPALPHTSFTFTRRTEAFEFMARARHLGKVVLQPGDPDELRAIAHPAAPTGRPWTAFISSSPHLESSPTQTAPMAAGSAIATASGDVENTIATIWQELLGIDQVGIDDDFFSLRGDSLLAAQVMARIQSGLAVKLPLSSIFDTPTVRGLAEKVKATREPPVVVGDDEEEGEL